MFDESTVNLASDLHISKIINIINAFRQRSSLVTYVKRNPDVMIHVHTSIGWTLLKDLFIISKIRKNTKSKIILSIHFAELNKIVSSVAAIRKYELNVLKKCVDEVIFLSRKTQEEFVAEGVDPHKTSVLYTFHDFETNMEKDTKTIIGSPVKLLFVGSIDKRKGILDLLEVIGRISDQNISLDICGIINDESIRAEYENKVKSLANIVVEHGYVNGTEKREIFSDSDILILPSYGEGMPIVIMEGMASGNAIISTKVGSIPEIVSAENGILIDPGDRVALENAIMSFLNNDSYLKETKLNNIRKGMSFGLVSNIESLCSIYNKYDK